MKWFDNTALTLVIIGALNWLLVGIFKLDIVAVIFGNLTWLSRIIYTIIGLCGLYLISLYGRIGSVCWFPCDAPYRSIVSGNLCGVRFCHDNFYKIIMFDTFIKY